MSFFRYIFILGFLGIGCGSSAFASQGRSGSEPSLSDRKIEYNKGTSLSYASNNDFVPNGVVLSGKFLPCFAYEKSIAPDCNKMRSEISEYLKKIDMRRRNNYFSKLIVSMFFGGREKMTETYDLNSFLTFMSDAGVHISGLSAKDREEPLLCGLIESLQSRVTDNAFSVANGKNYSEVNWNQVIDDLTALGFDWSVVCEGKDLNAFMKGNLYESEWENAKLLEFTNLIAEKKTDFELVYGAPAKEQVSITSADAKEISSTGLFVENSYTDCAESEKIDQTIDNIRKLINFKKKNQSLKEKFIVQNGMNKCLVESVFTGDINDRTREFKSNVYEPKNYNVIRDLVKTK